MKHVVVAVDSFKGCCSSLQAGTIIAEAFERCGGFETDVVPMADGGEGTVDAVVQATGGQFVDVLVHDPLGRPVTARYGVSGDGVAVVEMAAASGLPLLSEEERNPLKTSTYGTGQLLAHALDNGARRIVLGIGGSATNDGGAGMAQALGVRFLDTDGRELSMCGGTLEEVFAIDMTNLHPALSDAEILVACDVQNPLCGKNGASAVFGPQKGADAAMVRRLDDGMRHFAARIFDALGMDIANLPGGGAAGGLGAGLAAFCGASLCPGFDCIAQVVGLKERLSGADLVVTGEGRTDSQTQYGKLPWGVGGLAKQQGIPCILLSGAVEGDVSALYQNGITAVFSAVTQVQELAAAIEHAEVNLTRAAENIARVIRQFG